MSQSKKSIEGQDVPPATTAGPTRSDENRSTGGDKPRAGRVNPRFTPAQKNQLEYRLRLTAAQVRALERRLGGIADAIRPLPRGQDVKDELEAMADTLERADQRLRCWRSEVHPSRKAEALGHFNVAAACWGVRGTKGIDLHDDLDPATLITMVARLARMAADAAPGKGARRSRERASANAVRAIVEALDRPDDKWSRRRAAQLKPSRSGDFAAIAKIVWEAALVGVDGSGNPSPTRSIRSYIERQKLG